jgi:hypothetical protein
MTKTTTKITTKTTLLRNAKSRALRWVGCRCAPSHRQRHRQPSSLQCQRPRRLAPHPPRSLRCPRPRPRPRPLPLLRSRRLLLLLLLLLPLLRTTRLRSVGVPLVKSLVERFETGPFGRPCMTASINFGIGSGVISRPRPQRLSVVSAASGATH